MAPSQSAQTLMAPSQMKGVLCLMICLLGIYLLDGPSQAKGCHDNKVQKASSEPSQELKVAKSLGSGPGTEEDVERKAENTIDDKEYEKERKEFKNQLQQLMKDMTVLKQELHASNRRSELRAKDMELILKLLKNLKKEMIEETRGSPDWLYDEGCPNNEAKYKYSDRKTSTGGYQLARLPSILEICSAEDSPVEARGQAEIEIRIRGSPDQVQNAIRLFCEKAGLPKVNSKDGEKETKKEADGGHSKDGEKETKKEADGGHSKDGEKETKKEADGGHSKDGEKETKKEADGGHSKDGEKETKKEADGAERLRQQVSYAWVFRLLAIVVESGTGGGFCIWLVPVMLRSLGFQAPGNMNGSLAQKFQNWANAHPQFPLLGTVLAVCQHVGSVGLGYIGMALVGAIGAWLNVSVCGIVLH